MPENKFLEYYEKIKNYIVDLEKIQSNLKKSINREFNGNYIENKREITRKEIKKATKLIYEIRRRYNCIGLADRKLKEKENKIKLVTQNIFTLLKSKENRTPQSENSEIFYLELLFQDMGDDYKYKEARGLPELGEVKSHTTIRDFIATIKGYYDTLNEEGKRSLISFITNTKITGSVKTKIGNPLLHNLTELKNLLNEKCGKAETEATLMKRLMEGRQGNETVEKFAEEISEITDKLTALKMRDLNLQAGEETTVRAVLGSQALAAFKKGLRAECQQAVCAAMPRTLEEAVTIASEMHALKESTGRVLQIKEMSCYNCGKKGHAARDCRAPNLSRRFDANNGQTRRRSENTSSSGCFICGRNNHRASACRNRWQGRSNTTEQARRNNYGNNSEGGNGRPNYQNNSRSRTLHIESEQEGQGNYPTPQREQNQRLGESRT